VDSTSTQREADPGAHGLLRLLAILAEQPVPARILTMEADAPPGAGTKGVEEDLTRLAAAGSVLVSDAGVQVPPPVRAAVLSELDDDERRAAIGEAARRVRAAFPERSHDFEEWPACEELVGHARQIIQQAQELEAGSAIVLSLLDSVLDFEAARGDYAAARELLDGSWALIDSTLAGDDPLRADFLSSRADLLNTSREHADAKAHAEQALAMRESSAASEERDVAVDHTRLGEALTGLGDLDGAQRELERAAAVLERVEPRSRDLAMAYKALGWVLFQKGDRDGARDILVKGVAVMAEACGPEHPKTAGVRGTLGIALRGLGELDDARREIETALGDFESSVGLDHPEVGIARSNLSDVLNAQGEYEAAREQLEMALAIATGSRPPDRDGARIRHRKLVTTLSALRHTERALAHAEEAWAITEATTDADNPTFTEDLVALAAARSAAGDLYGARTAYEQAIAAAERRLGPGSPELASHVRALTVVLRQLGDTTAALERCRQLLEIHDRMEQRDPVWFHVDRLALATVLDRLGGEASGVYERLGHEEAASSAAEAANTAFVALAEEAIQSEDPTGPLAAALAAIGTQRFDLATMALERATDLARRGDAPAAGPAYSMQIADRWRELARVAVNADEGERALRALEERLALLRGLPERDAAAEGGTLQDLGDIYRDQQHFDRAIARYREALELRRRTERPRDVAVTLLGLGRALEAREDHDEAQATFEERLALLRGLGEERDLQAEGVTLHDLADVARRRGQTDEAIALYREAVECKRQADYPQDLAYTLLMLGHGLEARGEYEEAQALYEERLELLRGLGQERDMHAEGVTLHDLADVSRHQGRLDEAIEMYRQARELKDESSDPRGLAMTLLGLARALEERGDYAEAEAVYREQLDLLRSMLERDMQAEGVTLHDLGDVYERQGRLDEAIAMYREALEHKRPAERPRDLAVTLLALALALEAHGDYAEAEAAYEKQLALLRSLPDRDLREEAIALASLGNLRLRHGRLEEAVSDYERAIACARSAGASAELPTMLTGLAGTQVWLGALDAAGETVAEAVTLMRAEEEVDLLTLVGALAIQAQTREHHRAETWGLLAEIGDLIDSQTGADPLELCRACVVLADSYERYGEVETASAWRARARPGLSEVELDVAFADPMTLINLSRISGGAGALDVALRALERLSESVGTAAAYQREVSEAWYYVGRRLAAVGDRAAALRAYDERLMFLRSLEDPDPRGEGIVLDDMADVHRAEGRFGEAVDLYRRAIARSRTAGAPRDVATSLLSLARTLEDDGRPDEAVAALEERLVALRALPQHNPQAEGVTLHDLAYVRSLQGRREEALDLYDRAIACKRSFDIPRDLAATLSGYARVAWHLGDLDAARSAAHEAGVLVRRDRASVPASSEKERLFDVADVPWPADGDEAWDDAELLNQLSPVAVAVLERLYARAATSVGQPNEALAELRRNKLVQARRPKLSTRGRRAALLLRAAGPPPPGIAARLGLDREDFESPGLHAAALHAEFGFSGEGDWSAEVEVEEVPPGHAGPGELAAVVSANAIQALKTLDPEAGDDRRLESVRSYIDAVTAAGDVDVRTLVAVGHACADIGDLRRASEIIDQAEHACVTSDDAEPISPNGVQVALAWHWLGSQLEVAGQLVPALKTYEQAAAIFARFHAQAQRGVLLDVLDLTEANADQDLAAPERRSLPWMRTHDARASRATTMLRLSRLHRLLHDRVAARAAAAEAGTEFRLVRARPDHVAEPVEPPMMPAPAGEAADAEDRLSKLSAPAAALLERLRADEVESSVRGVEPGLAAPPAAAWIVARAAHELTESGLIEPRLPIGWFSLTDLGRAVSRLLVEPMRPARSDSSTN